MSYQDHLKSCDYCQKGLQTHKPTIFIKSASSYRKDKKRTIYVKSRSKYNRQMKLGKLGAIIRGTSYPSLEPMFRTKGASEVVRKPGPIEREVKLKELGKMIRG
jgi:hypothetical protein